MILPPRPCAIIRLATAWSVKNRPFVLTAKTLSQLASVTSTIGPMSKTPALLTRMSTPPQRATTASSAASIEAIFVTSIATANALSPKARRGLLSVREPDVGDRDLRAFRHIALDHRRADAPAPPVMMATLFWSFITLPFRNDASLNSRRSPPL